MDQPTSIEIRITGKSTDVMRAALAAQRKIDLEPMGFNEEKYILSDGSDFGEKMKEEACTFGDFSFDKNKAGTAEFYTEQESYSCTEEDDIKEIAEAMIETSPGVEFYMTAVITVTYYEGYDICIDAKYVNGKLDVNVSEEYYESFDEDEDSFNEDE